jgi:acyl-CoA thioesterase YciA
MPQWVTHTAAHGTGRRAMPARRGHTTGAKMGERDRSGDEVNFMSRRWVRPEDLNANGTLFGGSLLRWIDEEATVYAIIQLGNHHVVTKLMSEINFVSSARKGDIIELGIRATKFGRTSLTMRALVRNIVTGQTILEIERIVFVSLTPEGKPWAHGYSTITYNRDRFPKPTGEPSA